MNKWHLIFSFPLSGSTEEAPSLVWRRWMVEWSSPVSEFRNHNIAERLETAEQRTGRKPRRQS